MLDNPRKTETLMAALKAAVPFEVELTPEVVKQLQAQSLAHADQTHRIVSDLSYAGDEGGIACHIVPLDKKDALFISINGAGRVRAESQLRRLRVLTLAPFTTLRPRSCLD